MPNVMVPLVRVEHKITIQKVLSNLSQSADFGRKPTDQISAEVKKTEPAEVFDSGRNFLDLAEVSSNLYSSAPAEVS
jgi:hypothetical protein